MRGRGRPRGPLDAWRHAPSLPDVDLDALADLGIRCVLLDRDNTCVPRDTRVAPPEVMAWLESARERGMSLCLVTNNFHTAQIVSSARELGCDVVHHAMKPAPFALSHALVRAGVPAEQAVLIGDQVFTDVAAGNLAGVRTILVRPQSTTDLWYTHVFRLFEGPFLEGEPLGKAR